MTAPRPAPRGRAAAPTRRAWPTWLPVGLLLAALLAGGAYGYRFLADPGLLPLQVVRVKGEFRHLDRADIERTVAGAIDGGFFGCDMHALRRAVLEMPWVADASVRRVWPDTLEMSVTEQVPLARWGDDALVTAGAQLFTPPRLAPYAGLVRLHGPAGSTGRVIRFYGRLLPAARHHGLGVRAVEQDARRHWWVTFDDGLVLSLGREDVERRLAQFFRVYPGLAGQSARLPARVDMRYAHGFAVRWREATEDPAAPPPKQRPGKQA